MTLDLEDCILAGTAMTAPFLHDGLAGVLDLPNGSETGWDALGGSLRGGGARQHVTTKLARALGTIVCCGRTRLLRATDRKTVAG